MAGPPGDDNDNGCLGNGTIFSPAWPNSCPWLTNVGATKIYPGHTAFEVESAVVDPVGMPFSVAFSSGGGFSNIYPIPSYQSAAVATYFKEHNPPYKFYEGGENIGKNGGVYNRIGRGCKFAPYPKTLLLLRILTVIKTRTSQLMVIILRCL